MDVDNLVTFMRNTLVSAVAGRVAWARDRRWVPLSGGWTRRAVPWVAVGPLWLLIRVLRWMWRTHRIRKALRLFPHRDLHWFAGTAHHCPDRVGDAINEFIIADSALFKTVFSDFLGPFRQNLAVVHPDYIKVVLQSSAPKAISDCAPYSFLLDWLGYGLLTSEGATWQRNRKLLTPAFHFDVLKPYVQIKNEAADTLIAKLEVAQQSRGSVEIYEPVSLCTLDILLKCAFSFDDADIQIKGESHPYVAAVIQLARQITTRLFNFHLYPNVTFYMTSVGRSYRKNIEYVHSMANQVIRKRRRALDTPDNIARSDTSRYVDFLDILLLARDEEENGLTEEEIRQEVDTFLFEGHDTTASGVSWALHTLAAHPEHQARAQREVDGLLRGRSPPHLTWDDLSSLPYLTLCIKECLRINPPVTVISRETTSPTLVDGVVLPPGTEIDVSIFGLHHNPHVWGDDHREFKPDRFLPDNMKTMDSFAYIPFSAGHRNCIGQVFAMHELKIVIARLLYRFSLRLDASRPAEHTMELVMRAKDGIHLILTHRIHD